MLTEEFPPSAPPRRGPGGRALLGAAGAAGALHLLALAAGGGLAVEPALAPAARARPVLIAAAPAPPPASPLAAVAETAPPVRRDHKPLPRLPASVALGPEGLAPVSVEAPAAPPASLSDMSDKEVSVADSAVHPAAATTDDPDAEAVPVYATVLPPDTRLHYEMRRGMLSGGGDLLWQRTGMAYELQLQADVAGIQVLTETSTGRIDAHGLAPLRYTDSRARRGTQAANFQREQGRITYSGPQVTHPLLPGTQDRLSWMVQIAGVLNADPRHAAPGGRLVFFVSGARGDTDVWVFRHVGVEAVPGPHGAIAAIRFTREPRKAYDRQVDVWLAPAHHHLPVRARFTTASGGEVFELVLRDIAPN